MKYVEVRKIYKDTINEVLENTDTWLSFLKSASWNFKYNFDDQILIYAQRPNATACAEMTEWNNKVRPRRWVNKDSKGIAIYAKEGSELPLRFVFDVSDTHNYRNTPYKLWEIKPEYENEIIEELDAKFGDIDNRDSFIQGLYDATYNMVVDNIPDYMETIEKYKKGTPLENLEHEDIQAMLITTVWASVFYMTISRCGINVEEHTDRENFAFLNYFKSTRLTTILGTATSDIAEMGLREIAKTVRNLQLEEINKNRTFAQKEIQEYSNIESKNIEGGINYEQDRIRKTWGLSNSEYNNEGGNTTNRQIRNNEEEISNGTQQSRIYDNESREDTRQTSNRDTGNGNEYGKSDSRENGETRGDNREIETDRPNEMGNTYEQLQDSSRGTSSQRSNLQLDLLTEEEQKQNITEAENASVFSFTQEMIDSFLKEGSGFDKGKFRIYEQLTKSLSSKENADFLKNEYGIGGRSRDEFGLLEDHNSKGITLKRGYEENAPILRITWLEAEKRIRELISLNRYFNDREKEEYEEWLENKNIVEISVNEEQEEKEEVLEEYIYRPSDRVYIGTNEYEIININSNNNTVLISDVSFPMLQQRFTTQEFEKRMKENPYNSHLKKSNRDDLEETEEETGMWAWKHPHHDGMLTYEELKGHIELTDVDFVYPSGVQALYDVSLYAKPGQKIAFVGATGAGKTTITNLINRFYDIEDGKIRYDGININKIKKPDLRRSLGIVLQDTNLFTGTIKENIKYGKLDATDEEVIEAAKLANAHNFIMMLPDGYDTMLTSNGANLSQGQRQLISIARAAVHNPPVMILDEATSSIDTRTEKIVQDGMDKLMQGRIVLVIAHRLSTVRDSKAIMVLDHGKIIERGDHNTLIEQKGQYYQLYTGAFELE